MLLDQLQSDLTAARRAQDKPLTLLLGTLVSDVKNRQLEAKRELTDDDVIDVLRKGIKKRRESLEMYTKGGREDLAAVERDQVAMMERYLPAQASADDIRAAVRAAIGAGASNIGTVMSAVVPQFKGRAEGGTINAIVREELAARA